MTQELSRADERLIDRYLDGGLTGDELARCRRRLEAEPALRAAVQAKGRLRRGFVAGREAVVAPAPGFAARVVAAARRLPPVVPGTELSALCRRILLAAAVVVALSLLWRSGLFASKGDGTLQAAPDEVRSVLDALDARIQKGLGETEHK